MDAWHNGEVTVTVDEGLVEAVQKLGVESLSSVVDTSLGHEVERRTRAFALQRKLAEWDTSFGPIPDEAAAAVVVDRPTARPRCRRPALFGR